MAIGLSGDLTGIAANVRLSFSMLMRIEPLEVCQSSSLHFRSMVKSRLQSHAYQRTNEHW